MNSTQKIIKYVAIAFAISLIVGIFMSVYELLGTIGGVITNSSDNDGLNISEFSNSSNILSVDIGASKLKIIEGEHLKVESTNKYITTSQENNKLSVIEKKHNLFGKKSIGETIIYIPKNMIFDEVYISNGAGTINIENITAKDLELELGAGKIEIDKITTLNDTEIMGGAGAVTIKNAKLNNLDLEAGVGEFTLNASLIGESNIEAGIGELNINLLDNKNNYSIYVETGIGSIKIDGKSVKDESTYGMGNNEIDVEGGIGSININFMNN